MIKRNASFRYLPSWRLIFSERNVCWIKHVFKMYVQTKKRRRKQPQWKLQLFYIRFSSGLVPEQTSKMAKAWKAVCIWCCSPGAWHGLPLVTPGAVFPRDVVPGGLPLGSWTRQCPGHLLVVLPGFSASHAVLSLGSSGCYTAPVPRSPWMPLFLQHVTTDRGHVLYSTSFPTWRGGPGVGRPTGASGWNSEGD